MQSPMENSLTFLVLKIKWYQNVMGYKWGIWKVWTWYGNTEIRWHRWSTCEKGKKEKKRCNRGGECYNNLNQKAKLRGPVPHLSSTVTVWALISVHLASDSGSAPLREAPGSDFSCFVKRIMTQMFAQVCSQSQKYQDSPGIYAMCPWAALTEPCQ